MHQEAPVVMPQKGTRRAAEERGEGRGVHDAGGGGEGERVGPEGEAGGGGCQGGKVSAGDSSNC